MLSIFSCLCALVFAYLLRSKTFGLMGLSASLMWLVDDVMAWISHEPIDWMSDLVCVLICFCVVGGLYGIYLRNQTIHL